MRNVEIKNIEFDEQKPIERKWKKRLLKQFPEAKSKKSSEIFSFLYNIAVPYDELLYLERILGYSEKQIERVLAARELLKYYIVSIEKYSDYEGPGNGL